MTPNPMSTRGTAAATAVWSVRQSNDHLLRIPLGEGVLAGPQGVEPEPFAELGDLEDALPGRDRLPALELVEVALGQEQADLHRDGCLPLERAYCIGTSSSSLNYTLSVRMERAFS